MKIKKGDTVMILTGSQKGATGKVLDIKVETEKVIVEGVNVRTLHQKSRVQGEKGQIVKREMPIALSNIAVVDPKTKKATRVGYTGTGRDKTRIARKSGATIPVSK